MSRAQARKLLRADLDEVEYHIDALGSIIKHEASEPKADADLLTTLNYALSTMKDRRSNLKHIMRSIGE